MAFVRQRCKHDCGIAAMAMLLDVSYEEVYRSVPWRKSGIINGTDTKMLRTAAASRVVHLTLAPRHPMPQPFPT